MVMNPAYFKRKAKESLKGNWQTALLVTFFAGCLFTLLSVFAGMYGTELTNNMTQASMEFTAAVFSVPVDQLSVQLPILTEEQAGELSVGVIGTGFSEEQYNNVMEKYDQFWATFRDPRWLVLLFTLLGACLFTPVLSLGKCGYFLKRSQGEDPSVWNGLFGSFPHFFRALGLYALFALKLFGWGLISLPVIVVLSLTGLLGNGFLGTLLVCASLIPALLCYMRNFLAPWYLAKYPYTGVRAAFQNSKACMKGKKRALFTLLCSFFGWYFALILAEDGMMMLGVPQWVLLTAVLFAQLWLNVYMEATAAEFFCVASDPECMKAMINQIQRMMREAGIDEEAVRSLDSQTDEEADSPQSTEQESDSEKTEEEE